MMSAAAIRLLRRSLASASPPETMGPASADDLGSLHRVVLARLRAAYREESMEVPRDLAKIDYELPASGITSHMEKLKKSWDYRTFPAWRTEWEATAAAANSIEPSRKKSKK